MMILIKKNQTTGLFYIFSFTIVCIFLFLLTSCSKEELVEEEEPPVETISGNLSTSQDIYQGFLNGDLSLLFETISEAIIWNSHSHPSSSFHGVFEGPTEVQTYFGHTTEVEIQKFDIQSISEAEGGDKVIVLIDVERTTIATQTKTNGQFVHVLHFDSGEIIQVDIYEASANL